MGQDEDQDRSTEDSQPGEPGAVSVVLVSYFTGPILFHAIDALLREPELGDLVVVDNGNTARSLRALLALEAEDRITLVTGHGNVGFGTGCNLGAQRARGDYLLLLNPDALIERGTLAAMIAEGEALERAGHDAWMMGVNLTDPDGTPQRGARRSDLTPVSAFLEVFQIFSRVSSQLGEMRINPEPAPVRTTSPIPVISGACMFMRRQAYLGLNGMDEDYFLHVEDIDFCLRFRKAGGAVFFAPSISLVHFQGASQETTSRFIEWQKARSFILYFHKHYARTWRWPLVLGLDTAILARFALLVTRNFFLVR